MDDMTKITQEMDGNSGGLLVLLGLSRTMENPKILMIRVFVQRN